MRNLTKWSFKTQHTFAMQSVRLGGGSFFVDLPNNRFMVDTIRCYTDSKIIITIKESCDIQNIKAEMSLFRAEICLCSRPAVRLVGVLFTSQTCKRNMQWYHQERWGMRGKANAALANMRLGKWLEVKVALYTKSCHHRIQLSTTFTCVTNLFNCI